MFDPNEHLSMSPQRVPQRPDRPLPEPIEDPRSQPWLPAADATTAEQHHLSVKQQVKHIGNFLVPIVGIGLILGVFAYLALILVGVYS